MTQPKKFMVGTSPRSKIPIGGHSLPGGTWFTSGDVGVPENILRDKKQYPFLIWEDDKKVKIDKKEEKKVPKAAIPTIEELEKTIEEMSFSDFRKWANKNYKVTGRSVEGIKKDILKGKEEL